MQDFIVLGMVPGTHIQFDFRTWLLFCASLVVVASLIGLRQHIRVRILSWYVGRLIRRYDLAPFATAK